MSFLAQKPELPAQGKKPERMDNRFDGPLPFVHGVQRVAFRHIETPWGYMTKYSAENQDPCDYYCMAGWLCHGPIDGLRRIYANGTPYDMWLVNPKDGSYYVDVELPYGVGEQSYPICFRLYWGYPTQPAEPFLNSVGANWAYEVWGHWADDRKRGSQPNPTGNSKYRWHVKGSFTKPAAPNNHPPYGGICYVVFFNFDTGFPEVWVPDAGQNADVRTGGPFAAGPRIPDLEFEVVCGAALNKNGWVDGGVTPVAANYDYLTHPTAGLALPDAVVPQAHWNDMAEKCHHLRWQGLNRISPSIAKSSKAASEISRINSVFGGLLVARNGQILQRVVPELGDANFSVWVHNAWFNEPDTVNGQVFMNWWNHGTTLPVRDTAVKFTGESSLRLDYNGADAEVGVAQELFTLDPGKTYVVGFWAKTDTTGGRVRLGHGTDWDIHTQLLTTDWAWYEFTFTPPNQSFNIHASPLSPAGAKVWVDDVWIRETFTVISQNDLIGEPEFEPNDSDAQLSEVTVKFLNLEEKLENDAITERLPLPSAIRGEPNTQEIDGTMLRDAGQARLLARRALAGRGAAGRIKVLRRKAVNPDGSPLLAGDVFKFNYAPWQLEVACRVHQLEDAGGESVDIRFEVEQNIYPENYSPAADTRELPPDPVAADLVHFEALIAPDGLQPDGAKYADKVVVLAQRESETTSACDVWLSFETNPAARWTGEEALLASLSSFAVRGTLVSGITSSHTSLILDLDSADYENLLNEGFTDADALGNRMLVVIGGEWISLGALLGNTGSQWEFACIRGVFETASQAHSAATPIWLIPKAGLRALSHTKFNDAPLTAYLKLIPKTVLGDGNPTPEIALALPSLVPDPPTGLVCTPQRGGVLVSWTDPVAKATIKQISVFKCVIMIDGEPFVGPVFPSEFVGSASAGAGSLVDRDPNTNNYTWSYGVQTVDIYGRTSQMAWPQTSGAGKPLAPAQHTAFNFTGKKRVVASFDYTTGRVNFSGTPPLAEDEPVLLVASIGASLPAGLSAGTTYYAATTPYNYIYLQLSPGGDVANFTDNGSGTVTVYSRRVTGTWVESTDPFFVKTTLLYPKGPTSWATLVKQPTETSFAVEDWYPMFSLIYPGPLINTIPVRTYDSFGQAALTEVYINGL